MEKTILRNRVILGIDEHSVNILYEVKGLHLMGYFSQWFKY